MQIHELNNYAGNLDSKAFVAVDDGNDTGKVSFETILSPINESIDELEEDLNGRIDNIIAGGDAPSAAEIIDARRGWTGVNYASLGTAIRAQFEETASEVDAATGTTIIPMSDASEKKYIGIPAVGVTIDLTPLVDSVYPYRYGIIECSEDDVFYINSQTNTGIYSYCFIDLNGVVLVRGAMSAAFDLARISAPENANKLIINTYGEKNSIKGEFLVEIVSENSLATYQNAAIINNFIDYELPLGTWENGKYIIASNGNVGISGSMACTDFVQIAEGQKLLLHVSAYGSNECGVAFYTKSKRFINSYTSDGNTTVTAPTGTSFARFSTKVSQIAIADAYVKNVADSNNNNNNKDYFIKDFDAFVMGVSSKKFVPSTMRLDYKHSGEVTPGKRFLAIGFDDFRTSDFSSIIPLFEKYDGAATFNRVARKEEMTLEDIEEINNVIWDSHEMGDHTFLHYAFPYEDALFNGQDPDNPDGTQTPYPTNAQLRDDAGNGRNAFYATLTGNVNSAIANSPLPSSTTWGSLTDAQCQTLREFYSVFKNPTLSVILDELSNKYLGTSGSSAGSWDGTKYTGGIFTGCKTSANHEVWERILQIVQCYYKEQYGLNWDLQCWSWPGEYYFGLGFRTSYVSYYDSNMTIYYNMNARFESSLYTDEIGNPKSRSFTDVLREFGYKYTHDYVYPSRLEYLTPPAMKVQFYLNEHLSKIDGVLYPTNRTVTYSSVANSYPSTFFTSGKTKGAQMYDVNGAFRNFIEALRHDTAHGMVHGEVIDSVDNYSMRVFFEEALRFCKSAGIDVITKAEAYDVCFNHPIENGNLIYNPMLVNSAEEYFTDATNIPTNPDGYDGSCSVTKDASGNILVTSGTTKYLHYGIPLGKIKYSADVKGSGSIAINLIKCGDNENLSSLTQLATITVDSSGSFTEQSIEAVVPNNGKVAWSQKLEGLDNKVMGLQIVYSGGLQIKNIALKAL